MEIEKTFTAFDGSVFQDEKDCRIWEEAKTPLILKELGVKYFSGSKTRLPYFKEFKAAINSEEKILKEKLDKNLVGTAKIHSEQELNMLVALFKANGIPNNISDTSKAYAFLTNQEKFYFGINEGKLEVFSRTEIQDRFAVKIENLEQELDVLKNAYHCFN